MTALIWFLLLLGIVLTLLDGVGVRHPRVSLGWLGVCAALVAWGLAQLYPV